MAQLKVIVVDATGAKKTPVELPDDVPMKRLIPALVTKMSLPTTQAGTPLVYKLDHKKSGKRLGDEDTLRGAAVEAEDIMRLLPESSAGCFLAGTRVLLENQEEREIELLSVGEGVLSFLPDSGAFSSVQLHKLSRRHLMVTF